MLEQFDTTQDASSEVRARQSRDKLHVVAAKVTMTRRLYLLWEYRPLLLSLVRKELSVKYKNSVLGFLWSMLNPALTLVIYYFVFQKVMKNGIPQFAIYLLCGLIIWNFFSGSLMGAASSVVSNSGIVKKVAFPREVLPLSAVGSSFVFLLLQGIVLAIALVIAGDTPAFSYLPVMLFALLAVVMLVSALSIFLSAVNVFYRDTQHLLEIVLMAWFWATPVVYPYQLIAATLTRHHLLWLYFLNPMTAIIVTFQRTLYTMVSPHEIAAPYPVIPILPVGSPAWYASEIGIVVVVSGVLFFLALRLFGRMEGNFAEEL